MKRAGRPLVQARVALAGPGLGDGGVCSATRWHGHRSGLARCLCRDWIELLGRYVTLATAPFAAGDYRKQVFYVDDPLEVVRDTSAETIAPPGLYAPQSGFGLVWQGDASNSPGYREALGWAIAPEFGYETISQCDDVPLPGRRLASAARAQETIRWKFEATMKSTRWVCYTSTGWRLASLSRQNG